MKSLSKLICETFGVEYKSKEFQRILKCCCLYISNIMGAFEFQKEIKKVVAFEDFGFSAKDFRLNLISINKGSVGLRFLILNIIKTNIFTKDELKRLSREFKVSSSDAVCSYTIINSIKHKLRRHKYVASISKELISPEAYHKQDSLFRVVYPKVLSTIRSVTYNKLRFLSHSTNTEFKDIHGELTIKAIGSFYKLMPTAEPEAYVTNYIRRSVTNHALNMIKTGTTQKRGRLIKAEADGFGGNNFKLLVASENQINVRAEQDEVVIYDSMLAWDVQLETIHTAELEFSITQILEKYKHLRNKSRLLNIVFGQEDTMFSQWLVNNNYINKHDDNIDFQETTTHSTFNSALTHYFKISEEELKTFLLNVRKEFLPNTNLVL